MSSDMEDLFGLGRREADTQEDSGPKKEKEEEKTIEGPAPHLVEAFCAALSRLELGRRLYSPDNKLLILMKERVDDSWRLISVRGEGIHLDLTENAMTYHDIEVFKQEGRDTIASRLFQDGIRRLSFLGTMAADEASTFLSIFDKGQEWQHEADLADRLWILDLKGMRYQAVDGFDELVKETRGQAQKQSAAAMAQLTGKQGAMDGLMGAAPGGAGLGGAGLGGAGFGGAGFGGAGFGGAGGAFGGALSGVFGGGEEDGEEVGGGGRGRPSRGPAQKDWGPTRRFDVDADGLTHMVGEIIGEGVEDEVFWGDGHEQQVSETFEHFQRMMAHVLREDASALEDEALGRILENMFREQLALDGDGMGDRIEAALNQPEPVGSRMRAAWHKVVEPKLFTDLLSEAPAGSGREQALTHLMEKYLQPTPEDLVAAVARNPDPVASGSLINMLHKMEEEPLRYWRPHLEGLPVSIIKVIAAHTNEETLGRASGEAFLKFLWASQVPELSVIAATITPRMQLAPYRELLLARLEDPVEEVRLTASAALRRLGDPKSGIYVLNLLRHAVEKRLNDKEIRELLHTLMELGGDRYVSFLEQCLGPLVKPTRGFLGISSRRGGAMGHNNPLGDEQVLRALARHGSPAAMALLKEAFNNGEPEIKSFIGLMRQDPEAELAVVAASPASSSSGIMARAQGMASRASASPPGGAPREPGGSEAPGAPAPKLASRRPAPEEAEQGGKEDEKPSGGLLKSLSGFMRRKS